MMTEAANAAGRPALVTGGGRNIGAEIARRLAARGHPVVVCARHPTEIEAVAASIREAGGRSIAMTADVTDADSLRSVVDRAAESFGSSISVLVNNAVQRIQRSFLDTTVEDWSLVIDIALNGAFNGVKAVFPGMKQQGWGRIINFSGMAAQLGTLNRVGIVTAKHGLIGFTKAVGLEGAPYGITCNAISPGLIGTQRDDRQLDNMGDRGLAQQLYDAEAHLIPVGRRGRVGEVGAACEYLVSEEAAFVTAQVLNINGGRYA
jgi:NAD(P)-dependent dehydrogenase (short-subunit alcohol dehydrogenase family)